MCHIYFKCIYIWVHGFILTTLTTTILDLAKKRIDKVEASRDLLRWCMNVCVFKNKQMYSKMHTHFARGHA